MAGARHRLYERDGRWARKSRFRVLQTIVGALSIGCAVFVLTRNSDFQPQGWKADHVVLYYTPAVGATIIFNVFFFVYMVRKGDYFSLMYTSMIHFLFTFVFAVMGCYITVVVVQAFRKLASDPYNVYSGGIFNGTASNGTSINVTATNAGLCPAFDSCIEQSAWVSEAHTRGLIAIMGCAAMDALFILHLILFFWCTNDSVFGTRPLGWKRQRQQDAEKGKLGTSKTAPSSIFRGDSQATIVPATSSTPRKEVSPSRSLLSLSDSDSKTNQSGTSPPSSPSPEPGQLPLQAQSVQISTATAVSIKHQSGASQITSTNPYYPEAGSLNQVVGEAYSARSSLLAPPEPTHVRRSVSTPEVPTLRQQQQQNPPPSLLTGPIFGTPSPPSATTSSARSSLRASVMLTAGSSPLRQQPRVRPSEPDVSVPPPLPSLSSARAKTKPARKSLLRNVESSDESTGV